MTEYFDQSIRWWSKLIIILNMSSYVRLTTCRLLTGNLPVGVTTELHICLFFMFHLWAAKCLSDHQMIPDVLCFTDLSYIKLQRPDGAPRTQTDVASRDGSSSIPPLPLCLPVSAVSSRCSLTLMEGGGLVEVAAEECVRWMWWAPYGQTVQVRCSHPTTTTATAATTNRHRHIAKALKGPNKQSGDNATSSCSPKRHQWARRAMECIKAQTVPAQSLSLIQEYFWALPNRISILDGPGVLAFIHSCRERTVPCSHSRMCWTLQQSFSIHQRQCLFFRAELAAAGVHSHEKLITVPPVDATFRAIKHQNIQNKRFEPFFFFTSVQPSRSFSTRCTEIWLWKALLPSAHILPTVSLLGIRGKGLLSFITVSGLEPPMDSQSLRPSGKWKRPCIYHGAQTECNQRA